MAQLEKIFSRIQLVYRRSQTATKIVVIVALVLSMGSLIALRLSMNNLQSKTEKLRQEAAALEYSNAELEGDIAQLGSVQSVVEIAEEELGLVQPGTVLFDPES